MQAVNYYIVVEKIKEEPIKVAGLILTDKTDSDNRYIKAKVISKGNLVEGIDDNSTIYYDILRYTTIYYYILPHTTI